MAVAIAEVTRVVASRKTPEGERIAEILEELRRERALTQKQLAKRLSMTEEGYRNYVKGAGRITRHTLPRWANALEMTIADLASRLEIDLLTETEAQGLRQELVKLLPDADAAELDDLTRRLATLPAPDRRQVLDGWADNLTGRLARLGHT